MPSFSPQHYTKIGQQLKADPDAMSKAVTVGKRITAGAPERAVIFTLRHLSVLTGVPYRQLREWAGRWGDNPYREFFISKKADGRKTAKPARRRRRRIAAPEPSLLNLQRWLVHRVLHHAPRHDASMAFHKGADLVEAARLHCGCRWLIKMDVRNFFESIHEPEVFKAFVKLGYPRLLAFELARLCTRVIPSNINPDKDYRRYAGFDFDRGPEYYSRVRAQPDAAGNRAITRRDRRVEDRIGKFDGRVLLPLGSLPQGAPTSPLLANLVARDLDDDLSAIAQSHGLVYTRYADDIALSTTRKDFTRGEAAEVIGKTKRAFERQKMRAHDGKTLLVPPGARKIVLGLAVEGGTPRLTREYRNKLRLHAYMLGTKAIDPKKHATALRFHSVLSMRRHIEGKIVHARRIEPSFADEIEQKLLGVQWPI